jgi:predicted phage tail protein
MLADVKQVLERELNSTLKTFAEWHTLSSKVMASVVAHAVGLLKSHMPDLNQELLYEDYQCEYDAERDARTMQLSTSCRHMTSP